jgi:hypothetical protein
MNTTIRLIYLLIILGFLTNCSSPSGSNSQDDELKAGTFEAQTTGAVENSFSGEASFLIDSLSYAQHLYLSLNAGKIPDIPDSLFISNYGIFLQVPLISDSTGILTPENSFLVGHYIVPNQNLESMYIVFGSVILKEQKPDLLSGEIKLSGSSAFPDSGEVEITGKFHAARSESLNIPPFNIFTEPEINIIPVRGSE